MNIDIYCHTNRINGLRYVGYSSRGIEKRWKGHVSTAMNGGKQLFPKAIREFGEENFDHDVICTIQNSSEAKILERHYIEMLNTWGPLGYNMSKGGSGYQSFSETHRRNLSVANTGKKKSAEHCKKISEREKGKLLTEERKQQMSVNQKEFFASIEGMCMRQKISQTLTGCHLSEEHKKHIRFAIRGKKRSDETRQKMKEAQRKRRHRELEIHDY